MDKLGVLYGTTEQGGQYGLGTVFELLPPPAGKTSWLEKQLYQFSSNDDGTAPVAGLTFGPTGVLYGTTSAGGPNFAGTIFELRLKSGMWSKTTLWNFGGSGDGSAPWAPRSLVGGSLYGTALHGGNNQGGVVFELVP
jgi:uncharacterized repeat protein (TIGR03803 family)